MTVRSMEVMIDRGITCAAYYNIIDISLPNEPSGVLPQHYSAQLVASRVHAVIIHPRLPHMVSWIECEAMYVYYRRQAYNIEYNGGLTARLYAYDLLKK